MNEQITKILSQVLISYEKTNLADKGSSGMIMSISPYSFIQCNVTVN